MRRQGCKGYIASQLLLFAAFLLFTLPKRHFNSFPLPFPPLPLNPVLLPAGPAPLPRSGHAAVALNSSHLGVHGGRSEVYGAFGDVWAFDTAASRWRPLRPATAVAPAPRDHHVAALAADGTRLLVVGGRVGERAQLGWISASRGERTNDGHTCELPTLAAAVTAASAAASAAAAAVQVPPVARCAPPATAGCSAWPPAPGCSCPSTAWARCRATSRQRSCSERLAATNTC